MITRKLALGLVAIVVTTFLHSNLAEAGCLAFLTGEFRGEPTTFEGKTEFTPSILFGARSADNALGIKNFVSSDTGVWINKTSEYRTVGCRGKILIMVDDLFYIGVASIIDEKTLRLANGTVLTAEPGATALTFRNIQQ